MLTERELDFFFVRWRVCRRECRSHGLPTELLPSSRHFTQSGNGIPDAVSHPDRNQTLVIEYKNRLCRCYVGDPRLRCVIFNLQKRKVVPPYATVHLLLLSAVTTDVYYVYQCAISCFMSFLNLIFTQNLKTETQGHYKCIICP